MLRGLRLHGTIDIEKSAKITHFKPYIDRSIKLVAYGLYSGSCAPGEPMTQSKLDAIFTAYVTDLQTGQLDNFQLVIGDLQWPQSEQHNNNNP